MTIQDLLTQFLEADIKLWVDGERLRYNAPAGTMTSVLQAELIKHKAEIIAFLKNSSANAGGLDLPLHAIVRPEQIPLSFAQQRVWFVDQLAPGNTAYNLFNSARLRGPLDVADLRPAFRQIVQRHESLRTTFRAVDGEAFQVIAPDVDIVLRVVDVSALPSDEVQCLAREEAQRPFDLSTGPLVRCTLLRYADDDHILLLAIHHIISDGWSLGILFREIVSSLQAKQLPALPLQYADFALWQREWLQGETLEAQLQYWKKQLSGAPAALELPTDHLRPALQTNHGARLELTVPGNLCSALRELSRQANATLFMTLLAAFQALLSRYSGQTDIVIGSPVANRNRAELEGLIGFFVNTLVLRTDFSDNPTFLELLQRVRDICLGAYDHQDLPFERLVDELRIRRDLSRNPIFQVMFVLQNIPLDIPNLSGLRVSDVETGSGAAQFDLSLSLQETPDGMLGGYLEYNTDLFSPATMERMAAHLRQFLEQVTAWPNQPVLDVPILAVHEREQILVEWNATEAVYPQDKCLHEYFEIQVGKTPHAIALVFEQQELTYLELDRRANQLAHYLQKQGVGPDVLVGICVERSLEMVVGLLGILKAGGAYVPIDPGYPADRLAYMLADSGVSVLLTQEHLLQALPESTAQVICLNRDWKTLLASQPVTNLTSTVTPANLAYMIYTSGSTGRPKGAMNTHLGICNRLLWMQSAYGLTSADRVLQKTPFSFDVSVWEFFWPLMAGARLVVAQPEGHKDSRYLMQLIMETGITTLHFVPSMLKIFLQEPGLKDCLSLKRVICSGEALSRETQEMFFACSNAELHNLYGPTEAAVDVTFWACRKNDERLAVPIGYPISNTQIYIVDAHLNPLPVGVAGELYIGGTGVARGYLNRSDLTAEKFIPDPFSKTPGARLYRTNDLSRWLPDGAIEYLGRTDYQVKIRGFRIELGEIETILRKHPGIGEAVVMASPDHTGEKRLVAYLVTVQATSPSTQELRDHLSVHLPEYMLPSAYVFLESFPLSPNGKVDRKALPAPNLSAASSNAYIPPRNELEQIISKVWAEVLQTEKVGVNDSFFDLGGHSLLMARVHHRLREALQCDLTMIELFRYPTVSALARHLGMAKAETRSVGSLRAQLRRDLMKYPEEGIAVIGMAGRFPGARNTDEFWQNLCVGKESISFFSDAELQAAGVDAEMLSHPRYVKAGAPLENIDGFDAFFFGYNPREAALIDPQQRLFLETAWEALEQAGYDSERYGGRIGVYASTSANTYLLNNLASNHELLQTTGSLQTMLSSDKDFLSTRVSYKLNLKGPSMSVQTACSSSLVAVHLACEGLLKGQSDLALAGGVSVRVPHRAGYLYQEGGITSPDGHCRAFDAGAGGTVGGSGVGVVVLKRLSQALADGDAICAVIKGAAINNDGSDKVGYTAPSIEGQAEVIAEAQDMAGVRPETITYIEAHGTGTEIGDPIEVAALTQAFGRLDSAQRTGFCALGSVKTNIGHLDAAAGVAGLIKTTLALQHQLIPPSLHFQQPNPMIAFEQSPFYVNASLAEWHAEATPRRAGVSSFGMGGTNAHLVLEESPPIEQSGSSRPWQLLLISAKTSTALEAATTNLAKHLKARPLENLADVAYTLQVGRRIFSQRRAVVCRNASEAVAALENLDPEQVWTGASEQKEQGVAFMFTGQGAQYVDMGRELYALEPVFREWLDRCCEILQPLLRLDLRGVLYPEEANRTAAMEQLGQTWLTQPALFVIEYALAQLWISWGVKPSAMIGHSIGEYVAACLAGVFGIEDALTLVAARGRLMQSMPAGAMLAVPLEESEVRALLGDHLSLAAVNGPSQCVVSGTFESIAAFEKQLGEQGISYKRLPASHAFHSAMMEPILGLFAAEVGKVKRNPPQIACLSNLTGQWLTADQATDPDYWAQHLRQAVRFGDGLEHLLKEHRPILLEVGPGQTLTGLALRHPARATEQVAISSLRRPQDVQLDQEFLLAALGKLWLAGAMVDWTAFYAGECRQRIALPTYPFERLRCWIEPNPDGSPSRRATRATTNMADWFYVPSWKRSVLADENNDPKLSPWLVFVDTCGIGAQLAARLATGGQEVISVYSGASFAKLDDGAYRLHPAQLDGYQALLKDLSARGKAPQAIVHLWNVTQESSASLETAEKAQETGFYSLLFLAQTLGQQGIPVRLTVISNNLHKVTGGENISPEKATLLGPVRTTPVEYPNLRCRSIDVDLAQAQVIEALAAEVASESADAVVAYRGPYRWVQTFEPVQLEAPKQAVPRLKMGGVYLVTGGLGGVGLVLARQLAQTAQARLVLVGRTALPSVETWDAWLAAHDADNLTSRRICQVRELESLGAQVMVLAADVADQEQMRSVLIQASEHFGQLNGVIHAAGVPGGGIIQLKTREAVEQVFASKVTGTLVLSELLEHLHLDFLVLCSSLSSVLSAPGQVDYCAANAFMDAFAHAQVLPGTPVFSINWNTWNEVGMAVEARKRPGGRSLLREDTANSLDSGEGAEAFKRILSRNLPQVFISKIDLPEIVAQSQAWDVRLALESLAQAAPQAAMHPRPPLSSNYAAPRDEIEQSLARLWQELLGVEQIGIHDNFFELGGDSLLSMRLMGRLPQLGLDLSPQQIFQFQTIAELAQVAGKPHLPQVQVEQEALLSGFLPLMPNQHWFFDQNFARPHYFNIVNFFEVRRPFRLEPVLVEQVLQTLLAHHDSLRLRFIQEDGEWRQYIAPLEDCHIPFDVVPLSNLSEQEQDQAMDRLTSEVEPTLNLSTGPLLRLILFDLGHQRSSYLFLVIHHLVTDTFSNTILMEDFMTVYGQLTRREAVRLQAKTTSFKQWSERLVEYANAAVIREESSHWQSAPREQLPGVLPPDIPGGKSTFRSTYLVSDRLDTDETKVLLQDVLKHYDVQLIETMLAVMAESLAGFTGDRSLYVDILRHGRNISLENMNVSRTMGWCVMHYPLLLRLETATNLEEILPLVREQYRRPIDGGIGYDLLRYMSTDKAIKKTLRPRPLIVFSHDSMRPAESDGTPIRLVDRWVKDQSDPDIVWPYLLELRTWTRDDRIHWTWTSSENIYKRSRIEDLSQSFGEVLRYLIAQKLASPKENTVFQQKDSQT